jgi:hypothetical protein
MNSHIQIITSPGEQLMPFHLISHLAGLWREQGHRVTVGPSFPPDADIGILHVDRTWVPVEWLPDNPAGRPLLNGSMLDISKQRISRNLLGLDSNYTGPVIIKTNANSFGWPEYAAASSRMMQRGCQLLSRVLSWRLTRQLLSGNYPILNSLTSVPKWVWDREDLVVEKFLPEVEGDEYVLRFWLFFGDQEYGARLFSRNPVVKVKRITRYEHIDNAPESMRQMRSKFEMDFGKFDYVMVDGEAVLLDVNKTPTVSAANPASANIRRLASGLARYAILPF